MMNDQPMVYSYTLNTGNYKLFAELCNQVYDPTRHRIPKDGEQVLAEDFKQYCLKNIHGIKDVDVDVTLSIFIQAVLYFKDQASLTWFMIKRTSSDVP